MIQNNKTILVVDDEPAIRKILQKRLAIAGYRVAIAADGQEALDVFATEAPDLVVLDVMLPKLDGLGVCQELRKTSDIPIIMLSALGEVSDRIAGLQLGADDYLAKPFSLKELEERINAVLRRSEKNRVEAISSTSPPILEFGPLRIELERRKLYVNEEFVDLTGMEFQVLELLVTHPGKTVPRAEILQQVWGYSPLRSADMRVVDVHVSRLRSKMGDDPKNPEYIYTDRGTGYYFRRMQPSGEAMEG